MTGPAAAGVALRKPYVTPYAEESVDLPVTFEMAAGVPRLTYPDALSQEWMFGVLWARCGTARAGTILWSKIHTLRQRRCMLKRLCRVCGGSAVDPETGRVWWVMASPLPGDHAETWPTVGPATCKGCVNEALSACPYLPMESPAVYTVGDCSPIGVLADIYGQDDDGRVMETRHQAAIGLDEFHLLHRALATQLIVQVHDLQPVPYPVNQD